MKLHRVLSWMRQLLPSIVVMLIIPSFFLIQDFNARTFSAIWFIFFAILCPYFLNRVTMAVGMDYLKGGIPSLSRASVFAELSQLRFKKQDKMGIHYLSASMIILKQNLMKENKVLGNLNDAILALNLIGLPDQEVPYPQMLQLANDLSKLPILNEIGNSLNSFLDLQEVKWTRDFTETPAQKLLTRMLRFIERYLLPIVLIIITFIGVLSETVRSWITSLLQSLNWLQLFGVTLLLVLLVIFLNFTISSGSWFEPFQIEYEDIKEMSKLQSLKEPKT